MHIQIQLRLKFHAQSKLTLEKVKNIPELTPFAPSSHLITTQNCFACKLTNQQTSDSSDTHAICPKCALLYIHLRSVTNVIHVFSTWRRRENVTSCEMVLLES